MDAEVHKMPVLIRLLDFPATPGGIAMRRVWPWGNTEIPVYRLEIQAGGRAFQVNELPANGLAQIAFRILKEVKQYVPDHELERMFTEEIGEQGA